MKKEDRIKVYHKYDGCCAYCGESLQYKDMQVDHIHPKSRCYIQYNYDDFKIDDFDNLNPACRRCNYYKGAYLLDEYRQILKTLHVRLEAKSMNKVAMSYGMMTIKPFDGKFYFEKFMEVEN